MRLVWPTRGRRRTSAAERVPTSIVERASQWPPASFTTIDRIGRSQSSWCHAHPGRTCCWIACTAIPLQQLLRMRAAPKLYGSRLPRSTGSTPSIEPPALLARPTRPRQLDTERVYGSSHTDTTRFIKGLRYRSQTRGSASRPSNAARFTVAPHLKPWKVPCRIPVMFMATRERPSPA